MAGGVELPQPFSEVIVRAATYAFSLETGQWRELAPLVVPTYDGVFGAAGTWTGSAWVGLAFPCRSGENNTEVVLDNCEKSPIGLRWEPASGWSVTDLVSPPGQGGLRFVGMSAMTAVVASNLGFSLIRWTQGSRSLTPGGYTRRGRQGRHQ